MPASVSTQDSVPFIAAQRLRKGTANSACGSKNLVAEAVCTVQRCQPGAPIRCRFDSAYYGYAPISAAMAAGAQISVTARMDPAVKRAITQTPAKAWKMTHSTDAIFDETTKALVSIAE